MKIRIHQSQIGSFFQLKPNLQNPYSSDPILKRYLKRILPNQVFAETDEDLNRFGKRIVNELDQLGNECEEQTPYLKTFDPWGKRIDEIVTCNAWKQMKVVSAEEGIVSIPYEGKYKEFGRLIQFSKLYMFNPSSGLYSCPLAMTDGSAYTIQQMKLNNLNSAFSKLTTRVPSDFWTSGQWMTERKGGSDVGNGTETIAVPVDEKSNRYTLHGFKWFSSATDADMTFTLARIADSQGNIQTGSTGLSMFFVKTKNDDGSLNNIQVMKLKNKLGTKQLPTGELLLDGTEAILVSEPGRGVAAISNMLTITRIHNASASVSSMRRILNLSRDYSRKRECFGKKISDFPLHIDTLASMEVETRGCTLLMLEVARLLGVTENSSSKNVQEDENMLRLLTPILKMYTAKKCIGVVSEGLESFGGQGYIEDTGLPRILRDAQVTPIWEGTTNILAMDVLRAIIKTKGAVLISLRDNLVHKLKTISNSRKKYNPYIQQLLLLIDEIASASLDLSILERGGREFSFAIGSVTIGTLLFEQAVETGDESDRIAAIRFVSQIKSLKEALDLMKNEAGSVENSTSLVFDGYAAE